MTDDLLPPMRLRLTSSVEGNLTGIRLNERSFTNFEELHQHIMSLVGGDTGPDSALAGAEIELDCDYGLNYEHVVNAITAITGYVAEDGQVVKLIEKIKFAPPKNAG